MAISTSSLLIPKPKLFDFGEIVWFLDRGYDDCMHRIEENAVVKLIAVEEKPVLFRVSDATDHLTVEIYHGDSSTQTQEAVLDYVTEWFDLKLDLQPFDSLLKADKALAPMAIHYQGLRLVSIPDLFEALAWSIIGQQINLSFAFRLKRRLVETFGTALTYEGISYHAFPTPAQLANVSVADLLPYQFSARKAEYLIGIANLFAEGKLSKALLQTMSTETMLTTLTQIRGIGEWTAQYALMKSLRVPTSIPYGDAGLHNALKNLKGWQEKPTREQVNQFFKPFASWESYLSFYLWRSLSQKVSNREKG